MQSPLTLGWRYRTAQSSTQQLNCFQVVWCVDLTATHAYIKYKYNSDLILNWMKTSINILSAHPVYADKNFDQYREVLFGDVLTDKPGEVLV